MSTKENIERLPSLLVLSKRGVQRVPLARGRNVAGRGDDADIRLEDERASRHHVAIVVDTEVTAVDLGSKNGTFLADRRLAPHEPVVLAPGTPLTIGSTVVMVDDDAPEPWSAPLLSADAFADRVSVEASAARAAQSTFGLAVVRFRGGAAGASGNLDTTLGSKADAHTQVARRIDRGLRELVRPSDVLSYGGPAEYRLLFPGADEEGTRRMSVRLARGLAAHEAPADVGFAVFPRDGRSVDELVRVAGEARVPEPATGMSAAEDAGAFGRLSHFVDRIAVGNIHVLLLGETGVGKEVLARLVHARSKRASERMVTLNCAALSESLLESELFGYERGAFTGAAQAKPGLLEHASGGTVFLDEVGEMPASIQARLLRVLEHHEVARLGSVRSRAVDVRFVAATNRDLEAEVAAGRFRRDLYFRLNGAVITLPPLRERTGEIPALAAEFAAKASEGVGRAGPPSIRPDTLSILYAHDWPGNVRELRNVIERAVLLLGDGDVIKPSHLPLDQLVRPRAGRSVPPPSPGSPGAAPPSDARERIIAALDRFAGNQTRAAESLGISRRTLVSRLRDLDIPRPRKRV